MLSSRRKAEILAIELPDDTVMAVVDWFEERLIAGECPEHEFRQMFRECCKANHRIGKSHKYQFMFYMADLLREYGLEQIEAPATSRSDEEMRDPGKGSSPASTPTQQQSARQKSRVLFAPASVSTAIIVLAVAGLLFAFISSDKIPLFRSAADSTSTESTSDSQEIVESKQTVVLETHSHQAEVTFCRLDANLNMVPTSVCDGPAASLASGMYFVSIRYPTGNWFEILRTVPDSRLRRPASSPNDATPPSPHRSFERSQRFVVLPEVKPRTAKAFTGPTSHIGTGDLTSRVTLAQYHQVATPGKEKQPAVVTWDEAVAFSESKGMRLPWSFELDFAGVPISERSEIWTIDHVGLPDEKREFRMLKPLRSSIVAGN